jgi:mannosyltransferase
MVAAVTGSPGSVGISRRVFAAAVLLIVTLAAWWRFAGLANPGLWLDEIFGVMGIGPEHGPLYYAVMRATTRAQPDEFLTRLPFAVAGVLSVAGACAVGRAASGPWLAVATGAVVATSPIHLYYSREARPYAFLLACGFAGLYAVMGLVRQWQQPSRWWLLLAASIAGALLMSANGIFVAAALLGAALWIRPGWRAYLAGLVAIAVLAAGSFAIVRGLYPASGEAPTQLPAWEAVRSHLLPLLGPMISGHREGPDVGPAAWLGLGAALAGALVIGWRTPRVSLALAVAAAAGLALPVATMLWLQHGISIRYELAMFPALAVLVAGPAAILDRLDDPRWRDGRWLIAGTLVLLAGLGVLQGDARRAALAAKADWRKVGAMIEARTAPGDLVVASNDWSWVCLQYYLPKDSSARTLVNVREALADAQRAVAAVPRAVLVSGGDHFTSRAVPRWMDTFPSIARLPREGIALSFYPDRASYLATAVTADEVAADEAALDTMLRGRIDMTVNARRFLLTGWHDAEVYRQDTPFRWADASATAYLPIATHWPTELSTMVRPHPRLVDRTLTVLVNGVSVASVQLTDAWTPVRATIARGQLKRGANTIELRTAEPPAPFDRGAKAVQGIELR